MTAGERQFVLGLASLPDGHKALDMRKRSCLAGFVRLAKRLSSTFCHGQPVAFRAICSGDGGHI